MEREGKYTFRKRGDIVDAAFMMLLFAEHQFDGVYI
jgi:hypothetical protein